jgi:predicted Zn-dependent protease
MVSFPNRLAGRAMVWLLAGILAVHPVLAGRAEAQQRSLSIVRDAEIEQILRQFALPIWRVGGIVPEAVTIALIRDDSLNAFVSGGQNVFFHTGLLMESAGPEEVIGVMAHESGHIAGGHLARSRDAINDATTVATLATLIGLAAAIGSGRGDVATGVIGGGQELARRSFFAFTRTQEGSADEYALAMLEKNGWPSTGMLSFMQKLAGQELRPEDRQVEYVRTHPLTRNRVEVIKNFVDHESKFSNARFPAAFYEAHARMKAKLYGFIKPDTALRLYPKTDSSMAGRYGRAVALYQKGNLGEALPLLDQLIKAEPANPYFQELKGQILFENGRAAESLPAYREAVRLLPESDLLRSALGHALLEAQDDRLLPEAISTLVASARLEKRSALVWRLLSSAYSRANQQPQLAYARAEEALARGDIRAAKFHADRAEQMLPAGSPEWIRAQDIRVMVETRVQDARSGRGG